MGITFKQFAHRAHASSWSKIFVRQELSSDPVTCPGNAEPLNELIDFTVLYKEQRSNHQFLQL